MEKVRTILFWILFCQIYSCGFEADPENFSMGEDFVSSEAALSVVDSFSASLSTVILDSVITSGTGVAWTGSYTDEELGKISASSYFEVGLPESFDAEKKDRYDSLTLVLYYTSGYYGDTLSRQQLHIVPLAEELDPGDYEENFYNTSSVRLQNNPIGSRTFWPRPSADDSLRIRLSDNFGRELLDKIINKHDDVSIEERFREYFKGIALVPGVENTAILGFSASDSTTRMVLHTTRPGSENTEVENVFPLTNDSYQFNKFTADRSGTSLDGLDSRKKLPSASSENKTFVQSGFGVLTRVDFPSMQVLLELEQSYVLFKVELILIPEPGTYYELALPSEVVLYHTDKNNNLVSEIVDSYGAVSAAEFYIDSVYHENTGYKFDITDFIKSELSKGYFNPEHGLFIGETYTKIGSSLNRIVFSARKGSIYKPQLKLYFLFYNL